MQNTKGIFSVSNSCSSWTLNKSELLAFALQEVLYVKAIIGQTLNIVKAKNEVNVKNFLDKQNG